MATLRSNLVVSLRDNATGPMRRLSATMSRFQARNRQIASSLIPGGSVRGIVGMYAGYRTLTASIRGTVGAAARFEAAMNRVRAVSGATGAEMAQLSKQARLFGRTTQFTASEAADAQEMLLRNSLSVGQVMNGAAQSTLALAAATGSQLAPAADLMTDIMQQFRISASETGSTVDMLAGLMRSSKFAFNDARLAVAQAGGVASGAGLSFEGLTAGLAATAHMFASGSDAGTSFKTFMLRLKPASEKARRAMEDLNLEFYGPDGQLKTMEQIAGELKDATSDLTEEEITEHFRTIFGTDAIRTAMALAESGREGVRRRAASIAEGDAEAMAEARLQGFEGARKRFASAMEAFGISVGNLALPALTDLLNGLTPVVAQMSEIGSNVDSIVQRIERAFVGLRDGLGLDDVDLFGGLRSQVQAFEDFILGTYRHLGDDAPPFEKIAASVAAEGSLQRITERFRALGAAIRGVLSGDITALKDLAIALSDLVSSLGAMGGAAAGLGISALWAGSRAIVALGMAIAFSRVGRISAMAKAIVELVDAFKSAEGLGDIVGHFQQMSTAMQLLTGFGGALLAGKALKGLKGLTSAVVAIGGRKLLAPLAAIAAVVAMTSGADAAEVGGVVERLTGVPSDATVNASDWVKENVTPIVNAAGDAVSGSVEDSLLGELAIFGGTLAGALGIKALSRRRKRRRGDAQYEREMRDAREDLKAADEYKERLRARDLAARTSELRSQGYSRDDARRIARQQMGAASYDVDRRQAETVGVNQTNSGRFEDARVQEGIQERRDAAREALRAEDRARAEQRAADAEADAQRRRLDEARQRAEAFQRPDNREPGGRFRPYTAEERARVDQNRRDRALLREHGITPRPATPTTPEPPRAAAPDTTTVRPRRLPGGRSIGTAIATGMLAAGTTWGSQAWARLQEGPQGPAPTEGSVREMLHGLHSLASAAARTVQGAYERDPDTANKLLRAEDAIAGSIVNWVSSAVKGMMEGLQPAPIVRSETVGEGLSTLSERAQTPGGLPAAAELERIVELYRELGRLQAMPGSRSVTSDIREVADELDRLTVNRPEVATLGQAMADAIARGGEAALAEAAMIENALRAVFGRIGDAAQIQGRVSMDDTALDGSLNKAQRLLATLQQVGSAASNASTQVARLADNVSRSIGDRTAAQVRAAHGDVA